MAAAIAANTFRDRRREEVSTISQMEVCTMDFGTKTRYGVWACTNGLTVASTAENGATIIWKESECTAMRTTARTRASSATTKNTGTVFTSGRTDACTVGTGTRGSSMVSESTLTLRRSKSEACGKTVGEWCGSHRSRNSKSSLEGWTIDHFSKNQRTNRPNPSRTSSFTSRPS